MVTSSPVSLWLGTAPGKEPLERYLGTRYSEDGDFIPPPFCTDFRIERFDEDFRELEVYSVPSRSLRELLAGCSYAERVIPKFVELCGPLVGEPANAVLLLYDFDYTGGVHAHTAPEIRLTFVGTVRI